MLITRAQDTDQRAVVPLKHKSFAFGRELNYWTKFDLIVALEVKVTVVIITHPEGNMNVWTKFQDHPFNSCFISLKIPKVNIMAVLD